MRRDHDREAFWPQERALAIGGCGGGGTTAGGVSTTTKPADVSGTLTVWDQGSGVPNYDSVNDKLLVEFEKQYPNVKLDVVPEPLASLEATYQAAFTAHQGPDVMMMTGAGVRSYAKGLEVLNDLISPDLLKQVTNWGTVSSNFTPEGELWGVPIGAGGQIFYYNKDLFEKAGLPREFAPKTWDEVREAGEKLEAAGIQAFTGGNKEGYENGYWFSAGWQTVNTKEESIELGEGTVPLTDEAVTRAFGPEIMLQEAGLYPEERFSTPLFPDGMASFGEGKGAMVLGLRSVTGYFGEFNESLGEKNVGMFLPPGSNYMGSEAEWIWSIPKFAKNKDAAWAFIEFMASKESIGAFVNRGISLPNRTDVSLPAAAPEQARQLVDWANELEVFPSVIYLLPSQVGTLMTTEINEVLQGRMSLEEAQENLQEAAERGEG